MIQGRMQPGLLLLVLAIAVCAAGAGAAEDSFALQLPGDESMQMVRIPAGTYIMGSAEEELGRMPSELPPETVTIPEDFFLGQSEVTKAQWRAVMRSSPWAGREFVSDDPQSPAVYVSWDDAQRFVETVNRHLQESGRSFLAARLPVESEWEYACRAGTSSPFFWGREAAAIDDCAWYQGNAWDAGERYAHPVGLKKANAWGLVDMAGNAGEWCANSFWEIDSNSPANESSRVLRGGSWNSPARLCRSASRWREDPDTRSASTGFRVLLDFTVPPDREGFSFADQDAEWLSSKQEPIDGGTRIPERRGLPLPIDSTDGSIVFAATYRANLVELDRLMVGQVRLRVSSQDNSQMDVLTVELPASGGTSDVPLPEDLTMYFQPPAGSTDFHTQVEAKNLLPLELAATRDVLGSVDIRPVPAAAFANAHKEKSFSFDTGTDGWQPYTLPGLYAESHPLYDEEHGRLGIQTAETESLQFGFWGSTLDRRNNVELESNRIYFAAFTVGTDIANPDHVPTFRLRLNESSFRTSRHMSIVSTGANALTATSPAHYRVYFPPNIGIGGNLLVSFDLLADASWEPMEPGGSIFLDHLDIYSVPKPDSNLRIRLPDDVEMAFVQIPSGSFRMGSPMHERGRWPSEGPQHWVSLSDDFLLGEFEVTVAQWEALMGERFDAPGDHPAQSISWNEAHDFVTALNAHLRETGQDGIHVRLPSEAEWEYACRAGTSTRFAFGDSLGANDTCGMDGTRKKFMWFCGDNTPAGPKPVGEKLPNGFGLFDMHGNVYEWCQDWWHGSYEDAPDDGSAWTEPAARDRIVRGGYWGFYAAGCRSAARNGYPPDTQLDFLGFRVAADLRKAH
ncbi:formylglycine-generating enzyme family protein [bacterium]|nr:formylglycine-generating enzyme family protein [bacterium]